MSSIVCVCLLLLSWISVSRGIDVITSDTPLHNLQTVGRNILIGGENVIFRLDEDSFNPQTSIQTVNTSCKSVECLEVFNQPNVPTVFREVSFAGYSFVLFCGSASGSYCNLYNASDISNVWPIKENGNNINLSHGRKTIIVRKRDSFRRFYFVVAVSPDGVDNNEYVFSPRQFPYSRFNAESTYINTLYEKRHITYLYAEPGVAFDFIYGFETNSEEQDFTYILRNTIDGNDHTAYISQMCNGDIYFRSYIEAILECKGHRDLITATSFSTINGYYLLASFKPKGLIQNGPLCLYLMDNINEFFKDVHGQCFNGSAGYTPDWVTNANDSCTEHVADDSHATMCGYTSENAVINASTPLHADDILLSQSDPVTSIAVTNDDTDIVVALGTSHGKVKKIVFNAFFTKWQPPVDIPGTGADQTIEQTVIDSTGTNLIYLQGNNVVRVALYNCSRYEDCVSCLSDRTSSRSCVWSGGQCYSGIGFHGESDFFSTVCPPEIHQILPEAGPVAGGTKLTITGRFTGSDVQPPQAPSVRIGNVDCKDVQLKLGDKLKDNDSQIISCETKEVMEAVNDVVSVRVYDQIHDNRFQNIPINGATLKRHIYNYVIPQSTGADIIKVQQSGATQIIIHGKYLNSGSEREILIGGEPCVISSFDWLNDTVISCKTPGKKDTGLYEARMRIDAARVQLSGILYISDPKPEPLLIGQNTMISGGINLTITGDHLEGIGHNISLVLVDPDSQTDLTAYGPCALNKSESTTKLLCKTGPAINSTSDGSRSTMSVRNAYGELFTVVGNVTIHPDPRYTGVEHSVVDNNVYVTFKFKSMPQLNKENFQVTIGSHTCTIQSATESEVKCVVKKKIQYGLYLLPVKCQIGDRQYDIGPLQPNPTTYESRTPIPNESNSAAYVTVGIVVAVSIVVCALIAVVACTRSGRKKDEANNVQYHHGSNILTLDGLSESHASDPMQNRQNAYQDRTCGRMDGDPREREPLLPLMDDETLLILTEKGLLISSDYLILADVVGQGHFGCVYKAFYRKEGEKEEQIVAAKTLHRNDPKDLDVHMFLKEALIMKDFNHPNVMQLIGLCFGIEKLPLVVLPYMNKGDVLSYIRNVQNAPTVRDLVLFSVDIAKGMEYLSQLKFVHRDLAARNCMINEDMSVKVADFGLSRDVYEKEYYSSCDKKTKLPVKWMSPESLEFGHFSSKSDVWSFGVVLWELLTRGMNPYPTVDNWDMMRYLKNNRRLNKPDFCPEGMYNIMLHCWSWEPEDRPSFSELAKAIQDLLWKLERASEKRKRLGSRTSEHAETN